MVFQNNKSHQDFGWNFKKTFTMNGAMTTLGTPATITADSHTTKESALNIDSGKIVAEAVSHFSVLDYSFFVVILSLSALIGVYYGYFSKHKQNTTSEYILAGRSMSILPVATSLIATLVSFYMSTFLKPQQINLKAFLQAFIWKSDLNSWYNTKRFFSTQYNYLVTYPEIHFWPCQLRYTRMEPSTLRLCLLLFR